MKIDKDSVFWVVKDPTSVSGTGDVCWGTSLDGFADYIVGSHVSRSGCYPSDANMTIYDNEQDAIADARSRISRRDFANLARDDVLKALVDKLNEDPDLSSSAFSGMRKKDVEKLLKMLKTNLSSRKSEIASD